MKKIGLDIHGVVDRYSRYFQELSTKAISKGIEIHIITGQEWGKAKGTVENCNVPYTNHFSIVDHHLNIGTKMTQDENNTWWMEDKLWVRSKGDYIHRNKIDIHFDDSYEYAEYMPDFTTFILVPKQNFEEVIERGLFFF